MHRQAAQGDRLAAEADRIRADAEADEQASYGRIGQRCQLHERRLQGFSNKAPYHVTNFS